MRCIKQDGGGRGDEGGKSEIVGTCKGTDPLRRAASTREPRGSRSGVGVPPQQSNLWTHGRRDQKIREYRGAAEMLCPGV